MPQLSLRHVVLRATAQRGLHRQIDCVSVLPTSRASARRQLDRHLNVAKKSLLAVTRTRLRPALMRLRRWYLQKVRGMQVGEGSTIALGAHLGPGYPAGVKIGKRTAISFEAAILTHDETSNRRATTRVGDDCMIGAWVLVYPGVTIGNNCIISAASVVMKDVPSNSLVAGNPARVIESGIVTRERGIRVRAQAVT